MKRSTKIGLVTGAVLTGAAVAGTGGILLDEGFRTAVNSAVERAITVRATAQHDQDKIVRVGGGM
jgi:hypothetical protein